MSDKPVLDISDCKTHKDIPAKVEKSVEEDHRHQWVKLSGNWGNDHDSIMTLEAHENGSLTGSYMSGVSRSGGPTTAKKFVGIYQTTEYGFLVSFTAAFEIVKKEKQVVEGIEKEVDVLRHSNTVWCGQLWKEDLSTMKTKWILTSEKPKKQSWLSVLTNDDTFVKCYAASSVSIGV